MMKNILKKIFKVIGIFMFAFFLIILSFIGYRKWKVAQLPEGLEEVADGDAIFWLMQKPTNRFMPCVVNYHFDKPLDEPEILARLKDLVANYQMFRRNVVVVDGLPYWQSVEPDWNQNFHVLDSTDNLKEIRIKADFDISQSSELEKGLPLFRAYLTEDHLQLMFIWHHVISDFEGMFNKHAKHLFEVENERTRFGYQINNDSEGKGKRSQSLTNPFTYIGESRRKKGSTKSNFEVTKKVLPIGNLELYEVGRRASLPMSDIFSFIAMRTVTRYHELNHDRKTTSLRPVLSPLSLRHSSLDIDEGNNRAIKEFPLAFPLETVENMHRRILELLPSSSSYDGGGKVWKILRQAPFLESRLIELSAADYITNYFPVADSQLSISEANLMSYDLRVPMSPYEICKFAWSSYNGEVQLYLHIDAAMVDRALMVSSFEKASTEVLQFLKNKDRVSN